MESYYDGLAHMIMEAEKSHDLPPQAGPRKASGVDPVQTQRPEVQGKTRRLMA